MGRLGRLLGAFFGTLLVAGVVLGPIGALVGSAVGCRYLGDLCGLAAIPGAVAGLGFAAVAAVVAAVVALVRPPTAAARQSPTWWRVAAPGVNLADDRGSGRTVAQLEAGSWVIEYHRFGDQVLVATRDGLTGWVDADRLEPTDAGAGEGGG